MSLRVGVVDINPGAVGIPIADAYFPVSSTDEAGVVAAARDFAADGVLTLATDMPMRAAAKVCEELSLPGISYDVAVKATDKIEMVRVFEREGVAHPWYRIIPQDLDLEPLANSLTYPCICKPADSSGSRGVMQVDDARGLRDAVNYGRAQSRSGRCIVEELLVGYEVSVEVLVSGYDPQIITVTDKLTTGSPHFVETGHTQPSGLSARDLGLVTMLAAQAVRAIGVSNGAAHVEIMVTREGPKIIELGARLGGDYITSHLVPLSTGVDMVGACIRLALGETSVVRQTMRKGSAIRYFSAPLGKLRCVGGLDRARAIPGVVEVAFSRQVGEYVGDIANSSDRVGHVIAQAQTSGAAVEACRRAIDLIRF